MRKAAMSLPPSDFGSHRAIQAAARAADDLIAPYRARIEALEADRLKSKLLLCEAAASIKALESELIALGAEHVMLAEANAARIEALEGDADMVDEREMRSNLRIEALEAALGRLLAHVGFGNASQHEPNCKCVIHEACAVLTALAKGDEDG